MIDETSRVDDLAACGHRGSALVALHTAVALFGFAALFGQWIALPATAIVLGRTTTAAATLAIVARLRGQRIGRGDRRLAANGAILASHWVSFFAAVKIAGVPIALLGYAVFPVFVLLLERPHRSSGIREWTTALLATAGLVALVPELSWANHATRGLAWALVSAFTFAWLTVRNRALVATRSATGIALWQNLFAAVCLLPWVVAFDGRAALPAPIDIGLLLVLGTLCTGLSHTLFIASMRRVSAHTASVVAALEPVYGIVLAALLLGERPGSRTIMGGVLIVAAALNASLRTEVGEARGV
ncbi:MAG TPA: DMT family transporter [Gammaproteobacteria bacterium]|nr:DMT family transporter [Gammaproteobacteria bacterium]